jgi:hypothetical protein
MASRSTDVSGIVVCVIVLCLCYPKFKTKQEEPPAGEGPHRRAIEGSKGLLSPQSSSKKCRFLIANNKIK